MPRAKKIGTIDPLKEKVGNESLIQEAALNVAEEVVQEPKTSFDIINDADELVRTYSIEVHGENAEDLAKSYIEGHPNCHIQ